MSLASIKRVILATSVLLLGPLADSTQANSATLLVGAASSLSDVLQPIAEVFTRTTGDGVRFSFGSSADIARQTKLGAPFDVVMTADVITMDSIDAHHLLRPGSRLDIVGNTLDLIVPRAASSKSPVVVARPQDLLNPAIQRIAICPNDVPAGRYAGELLDSLGLREKLRAKLVTAPHVRAVLSLVAHGAVDAGFVYGTDARAFNTDVVSVFKVGRSDGIDIRYVAAVIASSKHVDSALAFVRILRSDGAWQLFRTWGFHRL